MVHLLPKGFKIAFSIPTARSLSFVTGNAAPLSYFARTFHERKKGPNFTFRRGASRKPLSKESIFSIILGAGVLGAAGGINLFLKWRAGRYADPSFQPVYDKHPPANSPKSGSDPEGSAEATPPSSSKCPLLPPRVKHVIVGAGSAGITAARAIRSVDPLALVFLIAGDRRYGEEEVETDEGRAYPPPYIRPVLSGGLWWRSPERRRVMLDPLGDIRKHSWFYYEPLSYFIEPDKLPEAEEGGVCLIRGNPVVALHPERHAVTLSDGQEVQYDCCLLATGARPREVPELAYCSHSGVDLIAHKRVTYFRNIVDYKHLQAVSDRLHQTGGRVAVLGSNQLACELATSFLEERRLSKEEKEEATQQKDTAAFHVHQFLGFGVSHPMEDVLPPVLAQAVSAYEGDVGVVLSPSATVVRASLVDPSRPADSPLRLTVHKREAGGVTEVEGLVVDHVVCSVGCEPRTELADAAGLEVDSINGGFLVNSELESRADIYVAGAAASYWDPLLNCRRRVDHISVSEDTGELAGLNMARSALSSSDTAREKMEEACVEADRTYDPLPFVHQHQSALWFNIGKAAHYDCVGLADSKRLLTRTVFLEGGGDSSAVVFYLRPEDNRLMGILLWNLGDELFNDSDYVAPSRINLARKMMASRLCLNTDEDLFNCAREFDLGGEIAQHYEELKAFIEAKKAEERAEVTARATPVEPETTGLPVGSETNDEVVVPKTPEKAIM